MQIPFSQLLVADRFRFVNPADNPSPHLQGNWVKTESGGFRHEIATSPSHRIGRNSTLVEVVPHTDITEASAILFVAQRDRQLIGTGLKMRNFISDRDDSRVVTWYDRRSRNYVIQKKDNEDNQIGEANYVGSSTDAIIAHIDFVKEMRKEALLAPQ